MNSVSLERGRLVRTPSIDWALAHQTEAKATRAWIEPQRRCNLVELENISPLSFLR